MYQDRPTRATLHAQLIWPRGDRKRPSKGARRHNRQVIANERRQWQSAYKPERQVAKPKPSTPEMPKKSTPKLIPSLHSSSVYQQVSPGKCPLCNWSMAASVTVELYDLGRREQVQKCGGFNCGCYFREYVPPVVVEKPTQEVDDYYELPSVSWPDKCRGCGNICDLVTVFDRFDSEEVQAFKCPECGKLHKQ